MSRLSSTSARALASDPAPRRTVEDEKRIARGQPPTQPSSQIDQSVKSPRRYPRYVPSAAASLLLLDLLLMAVAQASILLLIYGRLGLEGPAQAAAVVSFSVLIALIFLYATGCYRRDALLTNAVAMSRIPIALGFAGIVLFVALHYGFPYVYPAARVYLSISRTVTIILVASSISLACVIASRAIIHSMLNYNLFRRRILVIGTGKRARYIQELNENHAQGPLQEIHFASETILKSTQAQNTGRDLSGSLPQISAVDELSTRLDIDEVVIALDDRRGALLDDLVSCKVHGFPVTEFNSFIERQTGRIDLAWLEISWLLHSSGFQIRMIDVVIKRALDIVLSAIALFISLPVLLVCMAAIRLESPGPVFYRQQRVTLNGRFFWLFKLRTMRPDAEQDGPKWAEEKDPRVTKVGSFLRRTRLDEIPQLLNILWGDMSIVGPRPERPCFVAELSDELRLYKLRHSVRAGLTGWAQINYRYGASLEDSQRKLEYDLYYIKNFSLLRDITIMLQTLRVLLWPEGVR